MSYKSPCTNVENTTYRPCQKKETPVPTSTSGNGGFKLSCLPPNLKVFSCAGKHPVGALKCLRPTTTFDMVCAYSTQKGSALVYTTEVDGTTYQGEGTTGLYAKAIAATKALAGINAHQHQLLQKVTDYEEQQRMVLERITAWHEMQAAKEKSVQDREEKAHEEEARLLQKNTEKTEKAVQQVNKKQKLQNCAAAPVDSVLSGRPSQHMDYGVICHKYGPDVSFEIKELGEQLYSCDLHVQGRVFTATAHSKKGAKNQAVAKAFEEFETTPPPVINQKRKKFGKKKDRTGFEPMEPVEFEDKLAEKCWKFVSEKLADVPAQFAKRRNLVVMVKLEGEQQLDNCEIVSFGSGTLCVKKENMSGDGGVINDCTGDSLALRAFRRYLLDNIELCLTTNTPSIYRKDRGGKCTLKPGTTFYMYTNSCPMGDCRARTTCENPPPSPEVPMETDPHPPETLPPVKKSTTVTPESILAKMEADEKLMPSPGAAQRPYAKALPPKVAQKPRVRQGTYAEDLGKIQIYSTNEDGSTEGTFANCVSGMRHCIVSSSDKLALRQMVGVQGSMLSMISNPVYISKYLINRAYDETTLARALYDRVAGAVNSSAGLQPTTIHVRWRAHKIPEQRSKWAFLWAKGHPLEVIYITIGKQVDVTTGDPTKVPPKDEMSAVLFAVPSDVPSVYCTRSLYKSFSISCIKAIKKMPTYMEIKTRPNKYHDLKKAVKEHLEKTGKGTWPIKPVQPEF